MNCWINHSQMILKILLIACAPIFVHAGQKPISRKIISGYAGWDLAKPNSYDIVKDYLIPMKKANFTGIDVKIFNINLNRPDRLKKLEKLASDIHKYGLDFYAYATPVHLRKKSSVKKDSFINEAGEATSAYCLYQYKVFRKNYDTAFQLAKESKKLGIKAVKIDFEVAYQPAPCYCDHCWSSFAKQNGIPMLKASERFKYLKKHKMTKAYRIHADQMLEHVAKTYEKEMHSINPQLMLGMMPAQNNNFYRYFVKYLATPEAPAIMDSWRMYSGGGYNKYAKEELEWIKNCNPNNIAIPWFRINYYSPDDIMIQAWQVLKNEAGYNLFSLSMFWTHWNKKSKAYAAYKLPGNYSAKDYWKALGHANSEAMKCLENGEYVSDIKFSPARGIVPICTKRFIKDYNAEAYKINTKKPLSKAVTLRHENLFYVLASPGNPIEFSLAHVAGAGKMTPISYDILDCKGRLLQDESVAVGERRNIKFPVGEVGLYCIVMNGGNTGPWYNLKVKSKYWGLATTAADEQRHLYFFFRRSKNKNDYCSKFYLLPLKNAKKFKFLVATGHHQVLKLQLIKPDGKVARSIILRGKGKASSEVITQAVRSGEYGLWTLTTSQPDSLLQGEYVQNFYMHIISGLNPFVSNDPDSMLTLK